MDMDMDMDMVELNRSLTVPTFGGTEGMVVRAAVHSARTTLSGSRERGTFVSTPSGTLFLSPPVVVLSTVARPLHVG